MEFWKRAMAMGIGATLVVQSSFLTLSVNAGIVSMEVSSAERAGDGDFGGAFLLMEMNGDETAEIIEEGSAGISATYQIVNRGGKIVYVIKGSGAVTKKLSTDSRIQAVEIGEVKTLGSGTIKKL